MYALGIVLWTLVVVVSVFLMIAWWLEAEINMSPLGRRLWYVFVPVLYFAALVGTGLLIF